MARVRGSSRKAPPSRSSEYGVTKSSQKTDNNVISRSADSSFLEQQHLVDQMASSLILGDKRRVDSAAPDTPQEEGRAIPPEARFCTDGPKITTGSHPVQQRRRRSSPNPGQFHPDASEEQYMMGESSWKSLGPAPNEANEVRRMKEYQEQQALNDTEHPESPLDEGRPPHVPFPRFTYHPKVNLLFPHKGQDYERRSNERLGDHVLPLQRGEKEETREEMSLEEVEKYVDFDAGS
ncbi:hypothetical protein N0V90_008545 [Kalmusia sp. IMI 367209]|nr:hypothetical protein N0V90_008545 [Kalmusia sp. IMI 367209]